ncbi:hypothetical protein HYDPIDRAFT_105430 [Hydnomerulius pinastri MD-312]|nr:hypothetical protein HYDPIDRAFT_105430 [Hydnomerulius pinastri MD-312]
MGLLSISPGSPLFTILDLPSITLHKMGVPEESTATKRSSAKSGGSIIRVNEEEPLASHKHGVHTDRKFDCRQRSSSVGRTPSPETVPCRNHSKYARFTRENPELRLRTSHRADSNDHRRNLAETAQCASTQPEATLPSATNKLGRRASSEADGGQRPETDRRPTKAGRRETQ